MSLVLIRTGGVVLKYFLSTAMTVLLFGRAEHMCIFGKGHYGSFCEIFLIWTSGSGGVL